jgi:UPF0755 protein
VRRVLVVLLLAALLYLAWHKETALPVRALLAPPQTLVIPPGASTDAIGGELMDLGLVRHPLIFRALVLLRGARSRLRAGEYLLEGPLSLEEIVDLLVRGDVVHHEVTFPEGKSLEEMAEIVGPRGIPPQAFLSAARDPSAIKDLDPNAPDLEGYLFPDTYDVVRGPDAATLLVGRMVQRFRAVIGPDLPLMEQQARSLREIVTLASLVELETARPEERPRVAAVFLNRLGKGMLLQTDPTIIYALRKAGSYEGNIRKKDLEIDSPYNTYKHPGLPPGPIASPGRGALRAVLDPAVVRDLYFVSRNDGSHQFSETLADHERAVDRYQRQRGARPQSRGARRS